LSPGSPLPVSGAPTSSMSTALPTSTSTTTTDDVVCHPLCESHIEGEVLDPLSTLRKVEGVKAASYAHVLDGARSVAAVRWASGHYVHRLLFHLSGRPWSSLE
jgi:hypothetical protein